MRSNNSSIFFSTTHTIYLRLFNAYANIRRCLFVRRYSFICEGKIYLNGAIRMRKDKRFTHLGISTLSFRLRRNANTLQTVIVAGCFSHSYTIYFTRMPHYYGMLHCKSMRPHIKSHPLVVFSVENWCQRCAPPYFECPGLRPLRTIDA